MGEFNLVPQAHCDIEGIEERLGRFDIGAARKHVMKIMETLELLAQYPRLGVMRPELQRGLRIFPVLSYIIFYRLDGEDVQVLRITRGERDEVEIARELPPIPDE
jgi:toxin ParE1/3/4